MKTIAIVGGGVSGLFTALELVEQHHGNVRIIILDKGKKALQRRCPISLKSSDGCIELCGVCDITYGSGGAGLLSDGKFCLTASPHIGGELSRLIGLHGLQQAIDRVDWHFVRHGGTTEACRPDAGANHDLFERAREAGLTFLTQQLKHFGSDVMPQLVSRMEAHLMEHGVEFWSRTVVETMEKVGDRFQLTGVKVRTPFTLLADYLVIGVGRGGSAWLQQAAKGLGLEASAGRVDVGVRVEVPKTVTAEIDRTFYEAKLVHTTSLGDSVRTFCWCPGGYVAVERVETPDGELQLVNGHSLNGQRSDNTNFSLLVTQNFEPPFDQPLSYSRHIARLANQLSGGIMVQRFGDMKAGTATTAEKLSDNSVRPTYAGNPGDLGFVFPHRFQLAIREMVEALDRLMPGMAHDDTLIYGVETKFYGNKIQVSAEMEASVENCFVIGDGSGHTRSISSAGASGVVAARAIAKRLAESEVPHLIAV